MFVFRAGLSNEDRRNSLKIQFKPIAVLDFISFNEDK